MGRLQNKNIKLVTPIILSGALITKCFMYMKRGPILVTILREKGDGASHQQG